MVDNRGTGFLVHSMLCFHSQSGCEKAIIGQLSEEKLNGQRRGIHSQRKGVVAEREAILFIVGQGSKGQWL